MEQGQAPAQPTESSLVDRLANYLDTKDAPVAEEATTDAPEATEDVQEVDVAAEEQPPEEENTITIDPEAPMFEVTIKAEGGANEVKKVSLKDLESGYMMQADYQRKTAELARARETLTQEVQQMVEPERQQYAQNLGILQQAVLSLVTPDLQNVDWERLSAEDPARYVQLTAKAQKVQQTLQAIQQQQQMAQHKAFQDAAEQSKRVLADPVNGIQVWGPELYQTLISEASRQYGFRPDEVANVVDHRMIRVLNDAYAYRKLQSAKPGVEKKVTAVPKVLKPGRPAEQGEQQAKEVKELSARFKKSGNLKDATALYLARQRNK